MNVYLYQAALLCESCGYAECEKLRNAGKAPMDVENESTFDSDDYPKGPYPDGGGEADTPQHCDHCGVFLENPLTRDGMEYVREAMRDREGSACVTEWQIFYEVERETGDWTS